MNKNTINLIWQQQQQQTKRKKKKITFGTFKLVCFFTSLSQSLFEIPPPLLPDIMLTQSHALSIIKTISLNKYKIKFFLTFWHPHFNSLYHFIVAWRGRWTLQNYQFQPRKHVTLNDHASCCLSLMKPLDNCSHPISM